MNDNDPLNALLRQWKDVEPRPGFETRVLARIRDEPAGGALAWLRELLPLPAAACAGVMLGLAALAWAARHPERRPRAAFALADSGTFAGDYLAAASGGAR
jgi:hypothetical protein